MKKPSNLLAIAAAMLITPSIVLSGNVAVINGSTASEEPATTTNITNQLQSDQAGNGNTVTVFDTPPVSLGGFLQVWDIRFSDTSPLTLSDTTLYSNFLLGGGGMFLMGENSSFAIRNASLLNFIAAMGGGAISMGAGTDDQTVIGGFGQGVSGGTMDYRNAGYVTSAGTGEFITFNSGNGSGSALVFNPGTLSAAPLGTLTVIFDATWMQDDADADNQQLLGNLVEYLTVATEGAPAVVTAHVKDKTIEVVDVGAIASSVGTGLPMVSAQREIALGASRASLRDLNGRLFRLRASGPEEVTEAPPAAKPSGKEVSGKSVLAGNPAVTQTTGPWTDRVAVFASGDFSNQNQPALGESLDDNTYSGTVGAEYVVAPWLTLGVAATYMESNGDLSSSIGSIDSTDMTVAVYGSHSNKWFYTDLLYAYTQSDLSSQRITGLGGDADSDTNAGTHAVELNAGGYWKVGAFTTGPIGALEYRNGQVDGSTENGAGTANLNLHGTDCESLISRLGWQVSYSMPVAWGEIVPQLRVSWDRENLDSAEELGATLTESPYSRVSSSGVKRHGSFTATGTSNSRAYDYLSAGGGVMVKVGKNARIIADYEGNFFSDGRRADYAGLRLSWDF